MNRTKVRLCLIAFVVLLTTSSSVFGQATRTWVSGVGDDANPCSRTAPCKTFAGAISKTARGGEIDVLDPGGFGTVTITKSITIDGGPFLAGVLSTGVNGIIVNITDPLDTTKTVYIRNLSIEGVNGAAGSPSINGIRFIGQGNLFVERCQIFGFGSAGIDFEPTAGAAQQPGGITAQLWVTDTFVTGNNAGGILVKPGVGVTARAALDSVRMEKNLTAGLRVEDNSKVTVRNSISANNSANGFLAYSLSLPAELNLESVVSTHNGTNGIKSEGPASVVRISNVTVVSNNTGLTAASGGTFLSFLNNKIAGNSPGGDGVTPLTTPVK